MGIRVGLLLVVLTSIGALGCHTPAALESALPARHSLKSDQLLVLSDFKIAANDPLIIELRELRKQVSETLRLPLQDRKVVVYLFSNEDQYSKYMEANFPQLPLRRAFFIGSPAELAVYAFWGEQVRIDLRHEYTHGLLHAGLRQVPLWLDEGLAEYFEVPDRAPQRINVEHARSLAQAVQNGWEPDLPRLEQLEDVSEMHRLDYQESWAWIHFLLHESVDGKGLLLDYLNELQSIETPESLAKRIQSDLPHAAVRLVNYVGNFSLPHATASL